MATKGWWSVLKQRWQDLLVEYGMIAVATVLTMKLIMWLGFVTAIESGFDPADILIGLGVDDARARTMASGGTWVVAYGITELFKPLRLALVIPLTPLVARAWYRVRGKTPPLAAAKAEVEAAPPADEATSG